MKDAAYFYIENLMYSHDRKGPFKLYLYRPDGFHEGGIWFDKTPDAVTAMRELTEAAIERKLEVRICDGGDMLVYHAAGGDVLYGEDFFKEIA